MMDHQQFAIVSNLIVKYITSTISLDEQESLDAWISESYENRELFHTIISSENFYAKIEQYSDSNYPKAYADFVVIKEARKKKTISLKRIIGCAAAVVLIVAMSSGLYFYEKEELPLSVIESQVYDVPMLKLSNGEIVRFDPQEFAIDEIAEKRESVQLNESGVESPNEVEESEKISYNELIVPDKCRQKVILSDKSVVWVNSNSSIRYPVRFGADERRVFITGEALFEVTKDTLRPFIVETSTLSVNVTGTLFNVSAYSEQSNATVTLVNGSVTSNVKGEAYTLVPNQQFIFNNETQSTEIREVVAADYALWIDGVYVFNKVKLKDILHLIERCYGMNYRLEKENYLEMEITGELNVNKGIMNFIELLSRCSDFKFSLTEDSIIII